MGSNKKKKNKNRGGGGGATPTNNAAPKPAATATIEVSTIPQPAAPAVAIPETPTTPIAQAPAPPIMPPAPTTPQAPPKAPPSPQKTRAKAVDLVTGKAKVEYYFDPTKVLGAKSSTATPFKTPSKKNIGSSEDTSDSALYSSKHLFVPCMILKSLEEDGENGANGETPKEGTGPALVKTSDGTLYKIREIKELTAVTAPDDYEGVKDVLNLPNISEPSLLHTLRIRYKRDDIYTSAGPILISINPYKSVSKNGESLYSPEVMMRYRQKESFGEHSGVEPHLFQVADRAYSAMMDSVHNVPHLEEEDPAIVLEGDIGVQPGQARNQSVIISGESGAGKTEATKYIMQYLARITKRSSKAGNSDVIVEEGKTIAALEDRVLSSNPLLETFGNAQTLRNDNSSRFGKFIHINVSTETGAIVGARISNYLLEKTRITQQIEGERNYHIFYQLFAGAKPELLEEIGLDGGAQTFKYLGNRPYPKTKKDTENFAETVQCLDRIGLSAEDQNKILAFCAAVLHLGNVSFQESDSGDHSAVIVESSRPSLQKACTLLGLDEKAVTEAILTKLLTIGGKTIKKPSSVAVAEDKRDALAKMTYSCIFLWLVESINETLSSAGKAVDHDEEIVGSIGILDIFGFETFEVNGYEQLLINYCNECLQNQFNKHIFQVEQNLYSTEGVDWTYISFNDNRPCLELIEGAPGKAGILGTLDDAYAGMGDAAEKDVKFVGQLHKLFGSVAGTKNIDAGHEYFITPKFGNDRQFIIVHYAGEVKYTADGFVEKNMESLSNELKELGDSSTVELAKAVYSHATSTVDSSQQGNSRRSSIRGFSVASQFKLSLQSLVEDLEKTQPHYIRCIKPNPKKAPNAFNAGEILKQLRYSGMMEAIRIRREGYALREPHQSFFNRFSVLLGPDDLAEDASIEQLVRVLSKRLNVSDADWQIGHSKIFLRRELSDKLERLAKLRVHAAARCLGRFSRKLVQRRLSSLLTNWVRFRLKMLKIYRKRRAATKIQSLYRKTKGKQWYASTKAKIVLVQSIQRRRVAEKRVQKIRDPFCDFSYKDMKELLKTEKQALEKAVSAQDFKLAAEKEAKIEQIIAVIDSKKPMTRKRLEELISKAQAGLEDALQRKAYTEAGPIQDELEALVKQRQDLPTMAELKGAVQSAELGVASAAKNRDFAAAAAAQGELDEARKRLGLALEADEESDVESALNEEPEILQTVSIDGFECRSDLEAEIASLQAQVEAAIAGRDFKSASDLQATIENREKLRPFFPSLGELESDLAAKKGELEGAVARKDFVRAGKLNDEIERLEKQVEYERERTGKHGEGSDSAPLVSAKSLDGEEKHFDSRYALEEEIKATKATQSEAVAKRQFKRAEACQHLIEELEKLRAKLPTVAEMSRTIKLKKAEMQKAITAKRFADAESLDHEIVELEKKLEEEKARAPEPAMSPTSINAVSSAGDGANFIAPKVTVASIATPTALLPTVKASISIPSDLAAGAIIPKLGSSTSQVAGHSETTRESKLSKGTNGKGSAKNQSSVERLRPKKPVIASATSSVLDVCKLLASKRAAAALLVDGEGRLAGIITDTDVTRKVAAKSLDPSTTSVDQAMTPNPTCVSTTDTAIDAMATMLENRFRHLPVVDNSGALVGLLDIAKCLNDAITKIEKSENKGSSIASESLLASMNLQGDQAATLQALLEPLMKEALGSRSPATLRSLLSDSTPPIVEPTTSVKAASVIMAQQRKAALVVEDGKLVGIFGFKDLMTRVVAKELSMDLTEVSIVMTPSPESVLPDMTVLEALQIMHDNQFLTLPVCEDDGTVVGIVNVMDVIHGCGGPEGWQAVFGNSLELDDLSETGSFQSEKMATKAHKPATQADIRPVSKLRPKKPLVSSTADSVLAIAQMLATKRGDAALLVDESGGLTGIITDKDVTRRVVAKHLDPSATPVAHVMTKNPTCVSMSDSAMNAMSTMITNQIRHLPVLDDNGGVVGLLDIAKCLNDAISKLEKSQTKSENVAGQVLMQAISAQGPKGSQAAALQALLGPLMAQAFGSQSSPTLRSILEGNPGTIVDPTTSVRDAGKLMAECRKAALVVENGQLVGIFGFKDMMTRVVAKELQPESTEVAAVMTPKPEAVSPDMTVLEALQTMHDNKFLTLPVCEDDGTVVGLVDVMDVIYGCGGVEGWRSVFSSSLDMDDASENASVHSGRGSTSGSVGRSVRSRKSKAEPPQDSRPVSKLRPKKPLVAFVNDTVLSVTQMLASKRGDAALLVSDAGGLAGIFTDTDVTRRVVAKHLDASTTVVSHVMTKNPTCVSMSDSAMKAMSTMIENHFRHLPVTDDNGGVVGLLDIAKCLNDAISKLAKSKKKTESTAGEALMQAMNAQGAKGSQAAALQALLGPLMAQALGSQTSPSLRTLLEGKPGTIVDPSTSVLDAGMLMAERRKAALVVEDGWLVGIFGFKDMMTRVVAKELQMELTAVSAVMTPNPEAVSPDMTVLEALQTMHDNKFLTLPVCEDDGTVVGLVDVMDLIYGCGGVEGWRSVFNSTLDMDDASETNSVHSGRGSTSGSVGRSVRSRKSKAEPPQDSRPVSMLRPKKPLVASANDTVLSVTQMLASKRGDAALLVSDAGGLAGIFTDTDVTRRVVAKHLDASTTVVSHVMTKNPTCVSMSDSAMKAMSTMIENHFRHLPVTDDNGGVVGLLDIAKCLNDAISKLAKSKKKTESTAGEALMQAMNAQGAKGSQAAALQALLGPLMAQALGSQTSPSLRTLLEGKPGTIVDPSTSVLDAGMLMAERRKAALVVEDGWLVGIFGFKDMMTRVVAKELQMELTAVSAVMTPNPEAVSPDMTVLEALQTMHDNKFLTLPVCEDDGTVVGLVDVMDLIYGCGGVEGWRSVFNSTLDMDDASETNSVHSGRGSTSGSVGRSVRSRKSKAEPPQDSRPVSMLRPKKPLVASANDTVLSVTQMLASKRGDAALLVSDAGGLAGIFTDTDVTRRVVAKHLDASTTVVSHVMTKNPTCVSMSDSAMKAMSTMIENHFRHLPVTDDNGGVVGLLDIAKCLNDAISKLAKSKKKTESTAGEALMQAMNAQGAKGSQAAALQALLGPLMAQALGSQTSPSLRTLLEGKPGTIVDPSTSVLDAGMLMAERRKAALVVEDGWLVGIFGFKDMMTRVVAKELQMELTAVSAVMTPNPEAVSPDMTVLEALQTMHDNKFLTLPVCEDDGTVVGLVDVMDLIYGCGGVEGWHSVFNSTLDMDDASDSASLRSGHGSTARSEGRSVSRSLKAKSDGRTVSMLRPKKPLIATDEETIASVAKMLANKRGSAAIIVNNAGGLAGIITDTDFTRRVVAKQVDPSMHKIEDVMTPNPKFVASTDSAIDAMMMMIQNNFRHLPVSDDLGAVIGVLDIAKCLNDAISKLEKAGKRSSGAVEHILKQALENAGQGGAALQALLGPLVSQAFGSQASRSLGSILTGTPSTVVDRTTSVLDAAMLMAAHRKAALVAENGQLVGVFGFKDLMTRVIAKDLDPETTLIEEVMTPSPEVVPPEMTILEALQTMHDQHFLTLPVCERNGKIVGVVNVMDVINGCGGVDGWRAVFDSALEIDDDVSAYHTAAEPEPATKSRAAPSTPTRPARDQKILVSKDAPFVTPSKIPGIGNIPSTLEFEEGDNFDEGALSLNDTFHSDFHNVTFKVIDFSGHTHRLKSDTRIESLQKAFADKVGVSNMKRLRFKFVDDEGDAIMITNDDDLSEAIRIVRASSHTQKSGPPVVKLTAVEIEDKKDIDPKVLAGIGAAVALAGIGAMIMLRPRRYY